MDDLFRRMMEECASFSKICLVDAVVYVSCGLKSSSMNTPENMARQTSVSTLWDLDPFTFCAPSLWFKM